MSVWRQIVEFWGNGSSSPEFRRAQYEVLIRQVPLMYGILLTNLGILNFMFVGQAPFFLTVVVPSVFAAICIVRSLLTMLAQRREHSDAAMARQIATMIRLAWVLGTAVTAWTLTLFAYGDAFTKAQVVFFSGITIVIVITCLMPLRQVSLIMFLTVVVPMAVFLLMQPETVFKAIAINLVLVIGAMILVLRRSHSDLRQRVEKQVVLDAQKRELQARNRTIRELADTDSLTGLPNRRCFFGKLDELIARDRDGTARLAIGLVDLDGFKPVNDVLGHGAGDRLLVEVGERLSAAAPHNALVARLGGDEFGIILPNSGSEEELLSTCRRLIEALEPLFVLAAGTASVSGTCGVACYPSAGRTGLELFERADFALYHAKGRDRGGVTIFSDEHETAIKKAATLDQRLKETHLEEALYLQYQPIIDAETGAVRGIEALARWNDPVLGAVRPDVFIRTAEQNGMIGRLTTTLFDKALRQAESWPESVKLSFNLSAHDLCSPQTMSAIFAAIGRSGVPPQRIVFEITESSVMQDFDRALAALEALKAAGTEIALDDFGTGYSSLSYLRQLPIDRVKVDSSFVRDVESDPVALSLLTSIAQMCQNLGLLTVVEGVETESQLELLASTGCTAYQGYFFARPMHAEKLGPWLAERGHGSRLG